MFDKIEDISNRFQIIWDLGRRCSYACSYCPPHRNNKWSPMADFEELCRTMKYVNDYSTLYDDFRKKPSIKKLSFTGGEPTLNPAFFDFMQYISDNYSNYSRGLTTNGWFGKKNLEKVKKYTTTGTISYHCESTEKQKKVVIENIIELKKTYKVNVMFHKNFFDECVDLCDLLEKEGVNYIPRIIGDDINDELSISYGYTHVYSRDQMKWFRKFWNNKGQETSKKGDSQKGLGRPCCGGRCFKVNDHDAYFLPSTNFQGWKCMINWYFLFLNQELDKVWTHQTCAVNLNGEVAPLGNISNFDKIIDDLSKFLYSDKKIPMITCPKTFCGCGLCITKAKNDHDIDSLFKNHTKYLDYEIVSQKNSNYEIDQTTMQLFKD